MPAPSPARATAAHPSLAHDAAGHPLALPDGTAAWRVKRQTAGRPKVILGSDRQPVRLPLDATATDLLDMFGPGTYRLDAIDEVGQLLDYVTTRTVGVEPASVPAGTDHDMMPSFPSMRGGPLAAPVSDLRFALEAVAQLARTNGEALRSLADAQSDWIKALANAKAIPRNGLGRAEPPPQPIYLPPPMPLPAPVDVSVDDDEGAADDDGGDEEASGDQPEATATDPVNTALGHIAAITKNVAPIARAFTRRKEPAVRNAAPPPSLPAAEDPTPSAIDLAIVLDRLSPRTRALICRVLARAGTDPELKAWLDAVLSLPPDEAAAKLESMAQRSAERRAASDEEGTAQPEPPAAAAAQDFSAEDAAKAQAVFSLLNPMEQMQVMALLQGAPPDELEEIKAMLRPMAVEDAARWVRARIEAEAEQEDDDGESDDDGEE